MKRGAPLAVLVLLLGIWLGVAGAGEVEGLGDLALKLDPWGPVGVWKKAGEGLTGWEILPLGVMEIAPQELKAISGGGPFSVPSTGNPPGKIILWDEFRPQNAASGLQGGNYGPALEGNQQNLIMAVGR